MKIYELQERTTLLPVLLTIWEDSVRATHHFLSDTEIEQIREYVPQALQNVSHLLVAQNESGESIGFMGMEQYGIRELTVNEQNPQAVVFYTHLGFETYKRAGCDEEGNSYPLLYMTLKDTEGKI